MMQLSRVLLAAPMSLLALSVASAQTPKLVTDINTIGGPAPSYPWGGNQGGTARALNRGTFVTDGRTLYFSATAALTGTELYSTRGLPGTTKRLTDIEPGSEPSLPDYITIVGSKVFFTATNSETGFELYVYDTAAPSPMATLVKDILPGSLGSRPIYTTAFKGAVYFTANDRRCGFELWKSDGTAAGTVMVKDIFSGSLSSNPDYFTELNGLLYFGAPDSTYGRELWVTDGSAAGTRRVADICSGPESSEPSELIAFRNELYFRANDGRVGVELWRYNSSSGARLAHDIYPWLGNPAYAFAFGSFPSRFTLFKGELYFTAGGIVPGGTAETGGELWKTDGTTLTLFDIRPGIQSSGPDHLTIMGKAPSERLVFSADSNANGRELFVHDGATFTLIDVNKGSGSSSPAHLVSAGQDVYFQAEGATGGVELWKSDGTAAGTSLIKDINTTTSMASSRPSYGTASPAGVVVFVASDGINGVELWSTDGTAAGTKLLMDIFPGIQSESAMVDELVDANGLLYFRADDGYHGPELWKSDGTAAGSKIVADLYEGVVGSGPQYLTVVGDTLFFTATQPPIGTELHSLDLKTDKITMIDINPGSGYLSSSPSRTVPYRGKAYFKADGVDSQGAPVGMELYMSDGTVAGTRLVKDIRPGSASSNPMHLTEFRGKLYFSADDGVAGNELWITDGTAAGTRLAVDAWKGPEGSAPRDMTVLGDRLVFAVSGVDSSGASVGRELAISDGTAAGTLIIDIWSGSSSSNPSPATTSDPMGKHGFAVAGERMYFRAEDGSSGKELFQTDGRKVVLVKDINPGPADSGPWFMTPLGNEVFFTANDGTSGSELWKSNGTAVGTVQLSDIGPGASHGYLGNMTAVGSRRILFTASGFDGNGAAIGHELYVSDGTKDGTRLVADINHGSHGSFPGGYTILGGKVFFSATHGMLGRELFVVDMGGLAKGYGDGCGGMVVPPVLDSTDPVIGQSMALTVHAALANKSGMLLLGSRAGSSAMAILGGGCCLYLDFAMGTVPVAFRTDARGSWRLQETLPNSPSAIGLEIAGQAGIGPTSTPPLGLDLSNLLLLTPGK